MRKAVLAVAIISVFAASALLAAQRGPGDMVKGRVDRLAIELSLSASQKTSATACFSQFQSADKALEQTLRGYRKQLETDIEANNESGILKDTNDIAAAEATILDHNSVSEACFIALLNTSPDGGQRAKFLALEKHGGGFGGPGGPGGRFR
jgi:hypothetical protein